MILIMLNIKLQHLSTEDVDALMNRYYNGEKVSVLLEEFGIDCKERELYTLFPPEVFENRKCRYCNTAMIRERQSKSSFIEGIIYCPNCKHKLDEVRCKCESCNNYKRDIIINYYKDKPKKDIEELTLKERIYLAALLRGVETEEINDRLVFEPLDSTESKIATTYFKVIDILKELSLKGIISVNPTSDLDAFPGDLIKGDYASSYYIAEVKYTLNMDYTSELTSPNIEITNENINEIYEIVREISIDECYEYLHYQMEKVRFEFNPGRTTEEVFNELLDNFSIGQVYCAIYSSITQATRYYQEYNITKKHAANSVITKCRMYGERAISNNWNVKVYSRPYECKQSIISSLFFNRIISLGDRYLETVLSYENLILLLSLNR